MPLPAAVPIIAGAASLVGSLFNNNRERKTAQQNTDKTIAANKELSKYAYQKDLEQWHRANEYANPSNQMKRLKSAGLNPHLVYGSGSVTGNTGATLPKYNVPKAEYNYKPVQANVGGAIDAYQNTRLIQAQVDNVRQNTINNAKKEGLISAQKAKTETQAQFEKATLDTRVSREKIKRTIDSRRSYNALKQNNMAEIKEKYFEKNQSADVAKKQLTNDLQEMRNKWEAVGVTPKDKLLVRAIIRLLPQIGLNAQWMSSILGKDVMSKIMK